MIPAGKKVIIKPATTYIFDLGHVDHTWKLLKNAITEIFNRNHGGLSFEELYRSAYNMVLQKHGDRLYCGLRDTVEEHLVTVAEKIIATEDESFLERLNTCWKDHEANMVMIHDILMYMDRTFVPHNPHLQPVYDLGLSLFRDKVVLNPQIVDRIKDILLEMIQKERTGQIINRNLIKNITQMLTGLRVGSKNVYEEVFEQHILTSTATFYRLESQEFISSNSCPEYLKKVDVRRKEEIERVRHYLDERSSEAKIKEVVDQELIAAHMDTLVNMEHSGLVALLAEDRITDLALMYRLFSEVSGGISLLKGVLCAYVKERGKAITTDEEKAKNPISFVQELIDLRDKFEAPIAASFKGDKSIKVDVNKEFEHFINLNAKSPEFLSLFIDEKLKKGVKQMSFEELDQLLDKAISLFRFLQDKDLFEKYYKQHLAKRLLLGKIESEDVERQMLAKLKEECGYQFTSKLEGMFNDVRLSSEVMDSFTQSLKESHQKMPVDLNVTVLTMGLWPTQAPSPYTLPAEIETCCSIFQDFYLNKNSSRKLTWHANMGTAELKAFFPSGRYEITVSTFQMCILLLFNKSDIISYKTIQDQTNIAADDLKRNLMALTCGKHKILLKSDSKSKKIEESDKFAFNKSFKSKLYRFKLMVVAGRDAQVDPQSSETRQKVDEERKAQIDACIVRIMKSRKKMDHSLLISEVVRLLSSRFVPNPTVIKRRIESLIEREFMERSKTDRKVYHYCA